MAIADTECAINGHKITAIRLKDKMLPLGNGTPVVVADFVTMCEKCGLTLEEVKEREKLPARRIRRPKRTKTVLPEN